MADLCLGPLLRYVDENSATVWVEVDRPCEVMVVCDDGARSEPAGSWHVAGHHYALVTLTGLAPGTERGYRVELDGEQVWPPRDSAFPPSTIRTLHEGGDREAGLRVAFGSCRWSVPSADRTDENGPDALDALARELAEGGTTRRPDVLVMLGDQIYADETSPEVQEWLATRRDLSEPPWSQVADYEEYTRLYYESWGDPRVRWLLSTVPAYMIFDDHDLIDDWNTSQSWLDDIRSTGWWSDRVIGGLMSYWVYQHLGNLSPAELAEDAVFAAVRGTADGTEAVRKLAESADRDRDSVRWSYRRDFGRVRLVVVDSRSARVLDEGRRAMIDDGELAWLREQLLDDRDYDHLLVGTSLPWLLPPAIHQMESWDEAMCAGVRGARWAGWGEKLRRRADLEHWPAFRRSFDALAGLLAEAAGRSGRKPEDPPAPATICVLSGDVHHGYAAEAHWPSAARAGGSRVVQLTCSPVHNNVPPAMRVVFRVGWTAAGRLIGWLLARHGRLSRAAVSWRKSGGPWFGNQFMTLDLAGRAARLRLHQARRPSPDAEPALVVPFDTALSEG